MAHKGEKIGMKRILNAMSVILIVVLLGGCGKPSVAEQQQEQQEQVEQQQAYDLLSTFLSDDDVEIYKGLVGRNQFQLYFVVNENWVAEAQDGLLNIEDMDDFNHELHDFLEILDLDSAIEFRWTLDYVGADTHFYANTDGETTLNLLDGLKIVMPQFSDERVEFEFGTLVLEYREGMESSMTENENGEITFERNPVIGIVINQIMRVSETASLDENHAEAIITSIFSDEANRSEIRSLTVNGNQAYAQIVDSGVRVEGVIFISNNHLYLIGFVSSSEGWDVYHPYFEEILNTVRTNEIVENWSVAEEDTTNEFTSFSQFLTVDMGMTVEEVEAILGPPGPSFSSEYLGLETTMTHFNMLNPFSSAPRTDPSSVIVFSNGIVSAITQSGPNASNVSAADFEQLSNGLSEAQVYEILGVPYSISISEINGIITTNVSWQNYWTDVGFSSITVSFNNDGKVWFFLSNNLD